MLITSSDSEAKEILDNPKGVFSHYFLYLNTVSKLASGTLGKDINLNKELPEAITKAKNLIIVGNKKTVTEKLIQFIDSAVFVVKNYSVSKKYKILLPVNDSKGSEKAIDTAINFAKSYKLTVEIVAVYENRKSHEKTDKLLLRTKNKFLKNKINASTKILEGSTVNAIVDHAKDDSIIILGVSPKNPIMKYFFGSKPISIAQKCNCPVLITK